MGASAALSSSSLPVTPGSEVAVDVTVRNTGTVVDQFTIEVIGDAAAWSTVAPPTVSLFPGSDERVKIVFRPPMTADGPAGEVPFGVRVRSKEDPAGSVVEEGTLDIAPFLAVDAELAPRTSRGRKTAMHELAINNRGTRPIQATVVVTDPDQNLAFAPEPPSLTVEPNSASFVKLKVRATKPFRKGPAQTRMFNVVVEENGQPLAVAAGMMVQEETIPRWARRAAFWTVVGLLLLLVFWFTLGKPVVKSAAKQAAIDAVAPKIDTSGAGGGTAGGAGAAVGGAGAGSGTVTAPDAVGGGAAGGAPIDIRLFLTEKGATSYEVPAGATLQVTDIVLQNPSGDAGALQVRRNGTALLVQELANFRDLDFHFVAPIVFTAGQKLEISADCTSATCTPGAYFLGFLVRG
jgi:hypothetical protein